MGLLVIRERTMSKNKRCCIRDESTNDEIRRTFWPFNGTAYTSSSVFEAIVCAAECSLDITWRAGAGGHLVRNSVWPERDLPQQLLFVLQLLDKNTGTAYMGFELL